MTPTSRSRRSLDGARWAVSNYWRSGIGTGLVAIDAAVLVICSIDVVRFTRETGLSVATASAIGIERWREPYSMAPTLGVLVFFVAALPMLLTLVAALAAQRGVRPSFLTRGGSGALVAHVLMSGLIVWFTATAIAMEVLSGWLSDGRDVQYAFMSIWLGMVLLGKPAYVVFVSPIVKKFIVRFTADHKTKFAAVAEEVVTEEHIGSE